LEQVRWGGRSQDGAGNTVGEEVEQVNSFLSRAALTTKYMTKSGWLVEKRVNPCVVHTMVDCRIDLFLSVLFIIGRGDMITVLAMGWNHRKVQSLHKTLAKRFVKVRSLHCTLTNRI